MENWTIVAVPGRNRTLFRCVLQLLYRIFCYGWDSYAQCKLMNTWHVTQHVWAPPLTEVLCYSTLNMVMRSKYATK